MCRFKQLNNITTHEWYLGHGDGRKQHTYYIAAVTNLGEITITTAVLKINKNVKLAVVRSVGGF